MFDQKNFVVFKIIILTLYDIFADYILRSYTVTNKIGKKVIKYC